MSPLPLVPYSHEEGTEAGPYGQLFYYLWAEGRVPREGSSVSSPYNRVLSLRLIRCRESVA